jgi:hypothetical protein
MLPAPCTRLCYSPLQLAAPVALTSETDSLLTYKGTWYSFAVSTWPLLTTNTYYWVAVAPGTTMTLPNGQYNGALWTGVDISFLPVPTQARRDPLAFTGRQLISQRRPGDAVLGADRPLAQTFISSAQNWTSVVNASSRLLDWAAVGSNIRYGIQILGLAVFPSPSLTPSMTPTVSVTSTTTGSFDPLSRPPVAILLRSLDYPCE